MVLKLGVNQTFARKVNSEMVMRLLRKQNMTAKELAERLQISTAAISIITTELLKNGYIRSSAIKDDKKMGRSSILYSLNPDFACVAVVALSDKVVKIGIANMRGEIVEEHCLKEVTVFDSELFYEVIIKMKEVLQNNYDRIPLLGIEVSIPGKIDKDSGEIIQSVPFEPVCKQDKYYIKSLFNKHFKVPVKVNNDLNLAIIGEQRMGADNKDVSNALLVHLGVGMGGALMFDGNIYEGKRGFAGEIGMLTVRFDDTTYTLDGVCAFGGIQRALAGKYGLDIPYRGIYEEYNTGNATVVEYVNKTAKVLGGVLKDVTELLELEEIIISGYASRFGQEYLRLIQEEVNKSLNGTTVRYSTLNEKACMIGAAQKAVENLTAELF